MNILKIHRSDEEIDYIDGKSLVFNLGENLDIDKYISKEILPQINREIDCLLIEVSLSEKLLDFYGLRLVYHIRLSYELKNIRFIPIILISEHYDGCEINKLDRKGLSSVIFTEGIDIVENENRSISLLIRNNISRQGSSLNKNSLDDFLNKIHINVPTNRHDIANEWAIYMWAKELKISNSDTINKILEKLASQLYFKYIMTKYSIIDDVVIPKRNKIVRRQTLKIQRKEIEKKKVLYIDDEHGKGWDDIFKEYFSKKRGYEFNALDIEYKGKTFDNIEHLIQAKIIDYKPDLIILDMRLVKSDHNEKTLPEEISGIKILNSIKNISSYTKLNPGTQIIMLTASGRSDILDEALKGKKIVGYIKKIHPEDIGTNVKESIEKLNYYIKDGEENFYLKEIWNIQQQILNLEIFQEQKYNQIKIEVKIVFEILSSSLENRFKIAMLSIYKVLEILKDLYIEGTFFLSPTGSDNTEIKAIYEVNDIYQAYNKSEFVNGYGILHYISEQKDIQKYYSSTENKVHAIVYEKLNIKDKTIHDNIKNISHKRNKFIHPSKNGEKIEVYFTDIVAWFGMVRDIVVKIDEMKSK